MRVEAVGGVVDRAAAERGVAAAGVGGAVRGGVAGVRVGRLRLGLPRMLVRDRGVQPGPGEADGRHAGGEEAASCQSWHDADCDTPKLDVQTG